MTSKWFVASVFAYKKESDHIDVAMCGWVICEESKEKAKETAMKAVYQSYPENDGWTGQHVALDELKRSTIERMARDYKICEQ